MIAEANKNIKYYEAQLMTKTIKDLCNENPKCKCCPFSLVCPIYCGSWDIVPGDFNNEDNKKVTNAIIETARRLKERPE